jgi:pyruvate-formate lyase
LDEAQRLVNSLWQLIADKKVVMNHRVIIGGKGRRNEANADRFCMLAMEASRIVAETEPQLTLRFYKGQNPELMKKALDNIGSGVVYPMLFNDDAYVPGVINAIKCAPEDALKYMPYGCGETTLQACCASSPNSILNMHKLLEGMIFNGADTYGEMPIPWSGKKFEEYSDFEEFYAGMLEVMDEAFAYDAERSSVEQMVEAEECAFLLASALMDDCLDRGKALLDGGVRYKGGVVETYGLVNAADSLAVIKKYVYEKKMITPAQLQDMLRKDWEGYEDVFKLVKAEPKFGNDNPEFDSMLYRLSDDMCESCAKQAKRFGLDFYLACNVNNRAHSTMGLMMPATPDGRAAWTALANGTMPTAGNDSAGFTALAKSVAGVSEMNNAGYTHNLKFTKSMFNNERPKAEAMLSTFFALGATSAMITCVGKEDLQNAKADPEKHKNLMVRVGGFCARFVELEPELQDDLINRTAY